MTVSSHSGERRLALVTGGAGFIGSHLVEALQGAGWRVRVLDDLSSGSEANLAAAAGGEGRIELVRADVGDASRVAAAADGAEVVFHLAAIASVPRSVAEPFRTQEVNLGGTLAVLEAARRQGCRRVVFASSSAVYGDTGGQGGARQPAPISPYAVHKLASEHYLSVYRGLHGLETVALRFFNVYGARQDPHSDYAAVVPLFVQAALAGETLCVHGDGEQTRDFVHVSDVARAVRLAADAPDASGRSLDVGAGRGTRVLDLVSALEAALGHPVGVRHGPPRPGDIRESTADVAPIQTLLDWKAEVDLAAGVRHTIEAWRGHAHRAGETTQ